MKIYVDADGFPSAVKGLLIRAAIRLHVSLVFVANKKLKYESSVIISSIIVPEGPDIADDRIVELAQPGDLVITADIPLADRVIAKGAFALDYRGKLYTEDNIKDRLALRDLLYELRDGGMMTGGPSMFNKKDCHTFANQLDSFLMRQLKKDH
ncbi:MAG TPA: YaiI/YqxD family protein [Syntrophales bacterium]